MTVEPTQNEVVELRAPTLDPELSRALGEVLVHADLPPGSSIGAHPVPGGRSITLDASAGARLDETPDPIATAARLLELCVAFDEPAVWIGVAGEYDTVHLYQTVPTADLDPKSLIETARALLWQAQGVNELLATASSDAVPESEES